MQFIKSYIFNKLKYAFRIIYYPIRFGPSINIHPSSWISRKAVLRRSGRGYIRIGPLCEIGDYCIIDACDGFVVIGSNCSMNPFSIANGYGGLSIENDVRIASHCTILTSTHITADLKKPISFQGGTKMATNIASDVWIGSHTVILGGVKVGAKSIVGAGAIVNRDVISFSIVAGNPAKTIRLRI